MAVTFDASMTGGNSADGFDQQASGATSVSSTGMTIGTATFLAALLSWGSTNTPTSVTATWNSTSMTQEAYKTQANASTHTTSAIFYLLSPITGNKTLAASWTSASDVYMSAASFAGTDTTTGVQTSDTTTAGGAPVATTTITVTSTTDGATVANFTVDGGSPTVNFTKIYSTAPLNPGGGGSYTLGGTSNAHTFTGAGGNCSALCGIHILAASGGGGLTTEYVAPMAAQGCGQMIGRVYV